MLKSLIVDDEYNSREALHNLIRKYCPLVEVVAVTGTVEDALSSLENYPVDLVFLDIVIGTESGFDFLNAVDQINFDVVFTTAHEAYALQAIKYAALDYLLKPIDIEELQKAVTKAGKRKTSQQYSGQLKLLMDQINSDNSCRKIALVTNEEVVFADHTDIVLCEADGCYTKFYMKNGESVLVTRNLKEYEDLLPPDRFFRTHRSFLINLKEVKKLVKKEGGYLLMSNDIKIPLSKRKKEIFFDFISRSI